MKANADFAEKTRIFADNTKRFIRVHLSLPMPEPTTEPPLDLSGRTLGDFQVLRKLGSGGMGQVYLARQLSLKREVALKLLHDNLAANDTALKRFQAEAEAVAR